MCGLGCVCMLSSSWPKTNTDRLFTCPKIAVLSSASFRAALFLTYAEIKAFSHRSQYYTHCK